MEEASINVEVEAMSWKGPLDKYLTEKKKAKKYVNLTIYDIPEELIKDFMKKVVSPSYKGGISPAIKDLMRKAVQKQNQKGRTE